MKKLLFILMSFSLIACGSGAEEETETAKYYINIGDKSGESNSDMDVGFMSDYISQETEFNVKDTKLMVKEMAKDFKEDPMSIEGKDYKGIVEQEESTHCTVTFTKVTEVGKDDMKTDYELKGTIKTVKDEGSFNVTIFNMH